MRVLGCRGLLNYTVTEEVEIPGGGTQDVQREQGVKFKKCLFPLEMRMKEPRRDLGPPIIKARGDGPEIGDWRRNISGNQLTGYLY